MERHNSTPRFECNQARRAWCRSKRRGQQAEIDRLQGIYRSAKKNLRKKISKAKLFAWQELISLVDKDQWGLPYKVVLNRLRRSSPGLTETLTGLLWTPC